MGKCWISDSEMDRLLDLANKQYSDTICFASKPNRHLCAFSQIQTKLENIVKNGYRVKRILIALHVGSEDDDTTFISNGSKQGNHWSLLHVVINIENKSAYYGDSLGWSVPHNLVSSLEENLHMLERKLEIGIHSCLQDIITIHQPCGGNHTCSDQCTQFYPLQTCSNICGIITMCMVAVMTESWEGWLKWNNLSAPQFLQNPSLHGKYLRINALVQNKIDIVTLNKFPSSHNSSKSHVIKVDSMQGTPKSYAHVNTTGNHTNAGDKCSEKVSIIEDSKPTITTGNNIKNTDLELLSDDDFVPLKRETKQSQSATPSSSEDEMFTQNKTAEVVITTMLPESYTYKF